MARKNNNEILPIQQRLSIEEQTLARVIDWIRTSDSKVTAIFAFHAGLIAFLANKGEDIKKIWLVHQIDNQSSMLFLSLSVFAIFILLSTVEAFKALFPDFKPRGYSLLFFGAIPSLGIEKYKSSFRNLTSNDLEDELLSQIYINSEIASKKFSHVKSSIKNLAVAGVAWIIALITISILS